MQKQNFSRFRVPSPILHTAYRKQFCPKAMVPMESRDSEGVPFASLETTHLADIGPWRVLKSSDVTITESEIWHVGTHRKIHWFQKCYSFRSTWKNNKVNAEKPFQNSGVTRRLAVLNWRSSSIHPCCWIVDSLEVKLLRIVIVMWCGTYYHLTTDCIPVSLPMSITWKPTCSILHSYPTPTSAFVSCIRGLHGTL